MKTTTTPPEITSQPECGHWIGADGRYCGAVDGVRRYIPGFRCPAHTPATLQGKPEPQPGPGWPSLRESA